MNIADINNDITFLTNVSTSTYTAPQRLIGINAWYHKVITMILQAQDEWDFDDTNQTDFPILTTNLRDGIQDYSIPVSERVLKIKRVDVNYTGASGGFRKAEPLDIGERGQPIDATRVNRDFSQQTPFYDMQYSAMFLYPIPDQDVAAGLSVHWTREGLEFTSAEVTAGTKEPGFDRPFHRMLSIGPASDFAIARGLNNTNKLLAMLAEYEARIKQHYSTKQQDRRYAMKAAFVDYN